MTLTAINSFIATKPPTEKSIKVDVVHGVARINQKNELIELTVLFNNEKGIQEGKKLLVRGDNIKASWFKETYEYGGVPYILVPHSAVLAIVGE